MKKICLALHILVVCFSPSCKEEEVILLDRPVNLTASKGTFKDKILVEWTPIPGAENYEVYRTTLAGKEYLKVSEGPSSSFTDENISAPMTDFYYKVRVFNSESAYSEFSDVDFGYSNGENYQLIRSFGEEGSSPSQFGFVALISLDTDGIIYLSDGTQANIKKYTSSGEYLGLLKSGVDSQAPIFLGETVVTSNGYDLVIENITTTVNETGMNIVGQLTHDNNSNIYFAVNFNTAEGYNHHRIYKYDIDGNFIDSFGSKGSQPGQFNEPWGVSFSNDQIIVTSQLGKKAVFFTTDGDFVKEIDFSGIADILYGNFVKDGVLYIAAAEFIIKTDLEGSKVEKIGEGILTRATSVVVDDSGNVIVTEPYERKIRIFHE